MKAAIAAIAFCLAAAGQQKKQQGEDPPFRLPDTVETRENLVYVSYGSRAMHLDLFLPKKFNPPIPAIIYIHGGAWRGGNKGAFRRQAAHMAAKGFAGACIEYRLSGEAKYPAAVEDSVAALEWVRKHAGEYGFNPKLIGAAGGSAGGHLVAVLGTIAEPVKAVAAFNPVLDLVVLGKAGRNPAESPLIQFLGGTYQEKPDVYERASPALHVSKHSAAFLFLHGTQDTTVPYQQSTDMMAKLKAAGVHAEIFTAEGAGHAFFNRPPWYAPTLKRMDEFFTAQLK